MGLVSVGVASGCTERICNPAFEDCASTGGTAPYEGPVGISLLSQGCCADEDEGACEDEGQWWFDAVLQGTADALTIEITNRLPISLGSWSEVHSLPVFESDRYGWWEDRYLELDVADTGDCDSLSDCADRFRAGRTTLFSCPVEDEGITFILRLSPESPEEEEICLVWGAEPGIADDCTLYEPAR